MMYADEMYIQLHYDGAFDASKSKYDGGKKLQIGEFFIELFSPHELNYRQHYHQTEDAHHELGCQWHDFPPS